MCGSGVEEGDSPEDLDGAGMTYISYDPNRPYPWWTKIWPLGTIYFAGWARGEEAGIRRGRIQMGADPNES